MKIIKTVLIALVLAPMLLAAQIEIAPSVGYMFGGRLNYYQGELKIADNVDYGVSLIVTDISWGTDLEINYTRMDSRVNFRANHNYPDYEDAEFDVSVNYIQIGALKSFGTDDKFRPFGSFSAGTTIFAPKNDIANVWRFSITLGLGAKYWISDRVGIIVRGRLMIPMIFGGVGGYYGIGSGGSGGGLTLNSYSSIVQGDFSGGLVFSLGK